MFGDVAEISLYEGRTELSVIIDDQIIILIVAVRRRSRASNSGASTQLPTLLILKSKHNGEAVKTAVNYRLRNAPCGR
jgi:hypothetical protein